MSSAFADSLFLVEPFVGYASGRGDTKAITSSSVDYSSPIYGISVGFTRPNATFAFYGVFDVAEYKFNIKPKTGTANTFNMQSGSSSLALAWRGKAVEFRLFGTLTSKMVITDESYKDDSFDGYGYGIALGYRFAKYGKLLIRFKSLKYNKYTDKDDSNTPLVTDMKDININELSAVFVIPFEMKTDIF